jgi:hypothetical protein
MQIRANRTEGRQVILSDTERVNEGQKQRPQRQAQQLSSARWSQAQDIQQTIAPCKAEAAAYVSKIHHHFSEAISPVICAVGCLTMFVLNLRKIEKKTFFFSFSDIVGAPITSKSHTHPSYSQTSRLLTSSLSSGVPVSRTTQCM